MKFRIIPTILTNGITVVKGEKFNNWRTVGNTQAIARLFAARDVDEMMFLDVNARSNGRVIDQTLINYFAETLNVPFAVGGGVSTLEDVAWQPEQADAPAGASPAKLRGAKRAQIRPARTSATRMGSAR